MDHEPLLSSNTTQVLDIFSWQLTSVADMNLKMALPVLEMVMSYGLDYSQDVPDPEKLKLVSFIYQYTDPRTGELKSQLCAMPLLSLIPLKCLNITAAEFEFFMHLWTVKRNDPIPDLLSREEPEVAQVPVRLLSSFMGKTGIKAGLPGQMKVRTWFLDTDATF